MILIIFRCFGAKIMRVWIAVSFCIAISAAAPTSNDEDWDTTDTTVTTLETSTGSTVSTGDPWRRTAEPSTTTDYYYTTQDYPETSNYSGPGCGSCVPENIWTDVIFLIDSSDAATEKNVGDMWSFALTVCGYFNIQAANTFAPSHHMRVGVIAYSDDVRVVAPLGAVDYDGLLDLNVPFLGGGSFGTNIAGAIEEASVQFDGPNHRVNTKKVIIIMAVTYNPSGPAAAQKVAATFKGDNGIIISYNYDPSNGSPAPGLKELSSPGYFLYNQKATTSSINDMLQANCDANCFCSTNYVPYGISSRNTPESGCYYPVDIPANFLLANRNCKNAYNYGYLASAQNYDKQQFLSKLVGENYLIGLSFNNTFNSWQWSDGTRLADYHPGFNGDTSSYYMAASSSYNWIITTSRGAAWYVCETAPCSANSYCA